jgi:hypothetical protein
MRVESPTNVDAGNRTLADRHKHEESIYCLTIAAATNEGFFAEIIIRISLHWLTIGLEESHAPLQLLDHLLGVVRGVAITRPSFFA